MSCFYLLCHGKPKNLLVGTGLIDEINRLKKIYINTSKTGSNILFIKHTPSIFSLLHQTSLGRAAFYIINICKELG